ncbi:MAG TPA: sensor histidine kinase, partial [Parvularculaceae bacterium]|nr:sensor histidine kinase [Parvularculaceae bacterium]
LIEGDRELLMQAVANLLENALKHTALGTSVCLSVTPTPRPAISIMDTGEGVPPDELQKVLEPFYRRDQSRTTAGAGLGLSIVKAIADLHGARLQLESTGDGFRAVIVFC